MAALFQVWSGDQRCPCSGGLESSVIGFLLALYCRHTCRRLEVTHANALFCVALVSGDLAQSYRCVGRPVEFAGEYCRVVFVFWRQQLLSFSFLHRCEHQSFHRQPPARQGHAAFQHPGRLWQHIASREHYRGPRGVWVRCEHGVWALGYMFV